MSKRNEDIEHNKEFLTHSMITSHEHVPLLLSHPKILLDSHRLCFYRLFYKFPLIHSLLCPEHISTALNTALGERLYMTPDSFNKVVKTR